MVLWASKQNKPIKDKMYNKLWDKARSEWTVKNTNASLNESAIEAELAKKSYPKYDGEIPVATALGYNTLISMLCAITGKWGLYISFDRNYEFELNNDKNAYRNKLRTEIDLATNGLITGDYRNKINYDVYYESRGFVLFDTKEEMMQAYGNVVGDDGSETNDYDGPLRVYAMTVSPAGTILTENT